MDQTGFNEDQFLNVPHPDQEDELKAQEEAQIKAAEDALKAPNPKKKLLLFGGIGAVLVIVLMVIGVGVATNGGNIADIVPTPPPFVLPTNPPREKTEFSQKLENLDKQIDSVDPSEIPLDPPPLNYNITL